MSKVIIHKKGGGTFETTEGNLASAQRLLAGQITGIERPGEKIEGNNLANAIDDELIVEVSGNDETPTGNPPGDNDDPVRLPTKDELMNSDKDVLKKMADELAEKKGITKVNHRSGVEKLADYIVENQGE